MYHEQYGSQYHPGKAAPAGLNGAIWRWFARGSRHRTMLVDKSQVQSLLNAITLKTIGVSKVILHAKEYHQRT